MLEQRQLARAASVPSLTTWGVSADADLMYRCMLEFGALSAVDLERRLGLPRRRVTAGLDELVSIEAVAARPEAGRPDLAWAPAPPAGVVAALCRRRLPRANPAVRHGEPYRLVERFRSERIPLGDGVRHLPSRTLTRARLAELVGMVRHEHVAMSPERAYDAESARAAVPLDRTLLARGVRMRVLGAQPAADDLLVRYGRAPDEPRPQYRESAAPPMKLIIMDRSVALFPVAHANLDHGYLEVTQAEVVAALASLFEQQWAEADQPVDSLPRFALSERERALVELLAQGHTDSSAARRLRMSRRTVSTTVRALMDKLGVGNRFQLGLALGVLCARQASEQPVIEQWSTQGSG